MATKKKAAAPKDKLLASVQFVQQADGMIGVKIKLAKDCPEQTANAARIASDLLFKKCQQNGAVAVNLGGKVVLAEPALPMPALPSPVKRPWDY